MAKQVIINRFDGGIAQDIRTTESYQCEYSYNFNIFSSERKLIPYGDSTNETILDHTIVEAEPSDLEVGLASGTYYIVATGYEDTATSAKTRFMVKTSVTAQFISNVVGSNAYQKNSAVTYKDRFYVMEYNSGATQYSLRGLSSNGATTNYGTITTSSQFRAKPFVHPEDNMLYIGIGTTITRFNGTDNIGSGGSATYTTILPAGMEVVGLTNYGTYLAIGMRPLRGTGESYVYLWGRDGTLNTLQGVINFGEGDILWIENLDNNLVVAMATQTTFGSSITPRFKIKMYAGGTVQTMVSIPLTNQRTDTHAKIKNGGKIYFGLGRESAIFAFGKNLDGKYILVGDRYFFNGGGTETITGFGMIGDVMWRAFLDDGAITPAYKFTRDRVSSGEGITYTGTSKYKTTVNPSMPLEDRYAYKKLVAVRVSYTGTTSGVVGFNYTVDGSTLTEIISLTTTAAGEGIIEATMQSDGQPFMEGREFAFEPTSTGGAIIKEISYIYDVLPGAA